MDEIHNIVEKSNSSLLIIGSNDLTKKHVGPVTSNSLRTIPCDVLVLRDWQGVSFRRILVCADFSSTSGRALQRGISLARLHGAKLDVAYVMYPSSQNVWGEMLNKGAEDAETHAQHCKKNVEAEMDAFVAEYGAGIETVKHTTSILESASPGLALKYHVGDTGADLAILGSRVHSRLASLFSAANAEQLLHDSTVSVLAVRDAP
jgi:universal stress protein E